MNLAARVALADDDLEDGSGPGKLQGPYLRFRTQPRRRISARTLALFLVAALLLFTKVWERTVATSLSMERDRLVHDVRSLENRIRITRDLEEQAAFRSGVNLESLARLGFQNPDPAHVVDVDLALPRVRDRRPSLAARILAGARRALPSFVTERVVGLPVAPVEAGETR